MKRPAIKGRGAEIFLASTPEKEENQPTTTPDNHTTVIPDESEELVKATFYLAPEVVEDLDDFWFHLRKKTRRRARISKSQIVSHALGQTIRDLKDEPPEKVIEFFK